MTTHLSHDDLAAAAAEGALDATRREHLAQCVECRDAMSELSTILLEMKANSVSEPSPFFWEQFSARIREATATQPMPSRGMWAFSRPVVALGALAAVALLFLVWSSFDTRTPSTPVTSATADESATDPEVAWQAMTELAASMTTDDVRTATAPAPERAGVLSELSDDERAAFVELLKLEIGEAQ